MKHDNLNLPDNIIPRIELFTFDVIQQMARAVPECSNSSAGYNTPDTIIQKVSSYIFNQGFLSGNFLDILL
jgi:hypothetical protein